MVNITPYIFPILRVSAQTAHLNLDGDGALLGSFFLIAGVELQADYILPSLVPTFPPHQHTNNFFFFSFFF